jgi:hypothetical protein
VSCHVRPQKMRVVSIVGVVARPEEVSSAGYADGSFSLWNVFGVLSVKKKLHDLPRC